MEALWDREEQGKQSAEHVLAPSPASLEVILTRSYTIWKHPWLRVLVASVLDVEKLTPDSYFDQISYVTK